ncbi:hypothetical protein MFLO_05410 [Listeria floridensis FSL S10-1187]|uniref:Uncharacterized protein n=1 Tax=Listeria floridensis FSL S10-1187 TaxID=1265817 RepID=A0ABN0RGQ9_9LIST|nr:hypothetical protein [Listeria floridensis]EUJ33019.1 hypothetical protein MFLO_05410 [Listeria floridensis FSL S10-1187]
MKRRNGLWPNLKQKKQRDKRVREGFLNPEIKRSPFHELDLRTRQTKTKKDVLYQQKHKNHSFGDRKNGFLVNCFF